MAKQIKPTLESLGKRLSELETLAIENILKVEANLDEKYVKTAEKMTSVYSTFSEKLDKLYEEKGKELENELNAWITKEGAAADAHRAKGDQMFENQLKHMKVVEEYVHVQKEILQASTQILSDIRDCLKTLSMRKMRTGKNAYNDN